MIVHGGSVIVAVVPLCCCCDRVTFPEKKDQQRIARKIGKTCNSKCACSGDRAVGCVLKDKSKVRGDFRRSPLKLAENDDVGETVIWGL